MKSIDSIFSKKTDLRIHLLPKIFFMVLGLIPWWSTTPGNTKITFYKKIYFLLVLLVTLLWVFVTVWKEVLFFPSRMSATLNIFGIIASASMDFMNLHTVLSIHFWKRKIYEDLLMEFAKIDRILYKYVVRDRSLNWKFCLKIVNLKLILPLICGSFHTYLAWSYMWITGMESLQKYHMLFTVILVQHYMEQINCRYEAIGMVLARSFRRIRSVPDGFLEGENSLNDAIRCLIILSEQISRINDIYGTLLLLLMIHSITGYLYYFQSALFFYKVFDWTTMVVLSSWSWLSLSKLIIMSTTSMTTYKTFNDMRNVCYNCLHLSKFSKRQKKNQKRSLYEEQMLTLISHLYLKRPVFSVAHVFNLDNKWLFIVINATISYLLIILYF